MDVIKILRPRHWIKNSLCLAGVFFADRFMDMPSLAAAFMVAAAFCLASSGIYILNDLVDREKDKHHPVKKNRPLASGRVSPMTGRFIMVILLGVALSGSFWLHQKVFACIVLYILNNLVYSFWFKHKKILDVLSISFGFMLRLFAGVYVLDVFPTVWISLCTFFLTMLLGFSKRRSELYSLGDNENTQRASLNQYSVNYLDFLINSASTMTIISYGIFSTSYEKNPNIVLTLPIVYYAIMRYKSQVMIPKSLDDRFGEEPEKQVFSLVNIALIIIWLAVYFITSHGMIRVLE